MTVAFVAAVSELAELKNLFFYVHQNFLIVVDIILHRLPPESSTNIWAHSLQAILINKRSKRLKKGENPSAL